MLGLITKDYFWNTIGTSAWAFLSLLLLIIVTRINGIYDSGVFSFAYSLSLILFIFGSYGGRVYQVSDTKQRFEDEDYIFMRFVTSLIMLVVAGGFVWLNHYNLEKSTIIILLVGVRVAEVIADAIYGVFQKNKRLFIAGKSLFYKNTLEFVVFLMIDCLTRNLVLASASLVVVSVFVTIFYDVRWLHRIQPPKFTLSKIIDNIATSFTIMRAMIVVLTASLLVIVIANVPRYFMDIFHQNLQGYFGILIMPMSLVTLAITFVLMPAITQITEHHDSKDTTELHNTVARLVGYSLIVGIVILAGTYLVGVQVLNSIYNIKIDKYKVDLLLVVLTGLIYGTTAILTTVLTVMRKLKVQVWVFTISLTSLVLVSYPLTYQYAIRGSVVSYLIIGLLQLGVFWVIYYRATKMTKTLL